MPSPGWYYKKAGEECFLPVFSDVNDKWLVLFREEKCRRVIEFF